MTPALPHLAAHIYIVCSSQARVGTTTTARLLSEYQIWQERTLSIYDTDAHGRALSGLFPERSIGADLSRTQGQMVLFDGILSDPAAVRVVDLCARAYGDFFRLAHRIGWFEEVRRSGIALDALFVTDLSPDALVKAREIAKAWPGLDPIVVTNGGAGDLAQPLGEALPDLPCERTFEIEAFASRRGRRPELPALPLADACADGQGSHGSGTLRSWMGRIFEQFRCHDLRAALAQLR